MKELVIGGFNATIAARELLARAGDDDDLLDDLLDSADLEFEAHASRGDLLAGACNELLRAEVRRIGSWPPQARVEPCECLSLHAKIDADGLLSCLSCGNPLKCKIALDGTIYFSKLGI